MDCYAVRFALSIKSASCEAICANDRCWCAYASHHIQHMQKASGADVIL